MKTSPVPLDDARRLATLRDYELLDTLPEQALDDLTTLAASICGVPISLISLVDEHRQWFKSRVGLKLEETPREISFCAHAILRPGLFMVPDAALDERFADSPLVTGEPHIRFYAGAPLITAEGQALGTLCVFDRVSRQLTIAQQEALLVLSRQVMAQFELRRQTRRVRDSEARLRIVTDNARVGLVLVDRERRYIFANQAHGQFLGLPAADIVGERVADVWPRIYEEQIRSHMDRAFAGERIRYEVHGSTPRGARQYEVRYEPIGTKSAVDMIVVVITNVTEPRRAEATRLASEERYRALFDYAPDGILIADREGNYVDANPSICRMLGYSRDELATMSSAEIVDQSEIEHIAPALEAITTSPSYRREWRFRRRDGSTFFAEVIATTMPDGNLLAMVRDLTERHDLEAQFQQAQKMEAIGRLAGGVAHDFNNLLTVILGYCELLHRGFDPQDPRRAAVTEIQKAGSSAATLTSQLLVFSRKEIAEPTLLDLNHVVGELRSMLGRLIGEDVAIELEVSPEPAWVKADRGQLEQVVLNLAINSRDAMPNGGRLSIRTENVELDAERRAHVGIPAGPYVALTVTDTGLGMTPEVRARVFEPFFTTKPVGKGTGLGLATVHGIVARSGGSVYVESEIGLGASFEVYIPRLVGEDAVGLEVSPPPASRGGAETVLVVEDSEGLRELVRELLEGQGYTVRAAANAAQAVDLHDGSVDLLLTDVVMPGASGRDLSTQLMARQPGLKVVYMSGYSEDAIAHHGVLDSGISFLRKPFTLDALTRKVREALDG